MQPLPNSVWFAKMKGSNKKLIITNNDDDLVKRIDAKIAELEAKEKEEALNENKIESSIKEEETKDEEPIERFDLDSFKEETEKDKEEPIVNVDNDSIVVGDDNITDDQYYDDFFGDEE